jgi:hypothetical protein
MLQLEQSPYIPEEFEEALRILTLVASGERPPIHEINSAIKTLSGGVSSLETAVVNEYGVRGDDGVTRLTVDAAMEQLAAADMWPNQYKDGVITVDIHDDYSEIRITDGLVRLEEVRGAISAKETRERSYREMFR